MKLSQGAKGTEEIAGIGGIPEGADAISPNRHLEAGKVAELLDLVAHVREVTGKPVGIKTVMGHLHAFEALFEEVDRRGPESAPCFITRDGRVAHYAKGIVTDVETIACSVGVSEPRLPRRRHVRIVQPDGSSIPLNRLHPAVPVHEA